MKFEKGESAAGLQSTSSARGGLILSSRYEACVKMFLTFSEGNTCTNLSVS
jgi:hypothetical protein